jgi:hypothetical protein
MPRIELIPEELDLRSADGSTPTIDVCAEHAEIFIEGENWEWEGDDNGDCIIGSTDVDHPPYEDDEYLCAVCQKQLSNKD